MCFFFYFPGKLSKGVVFQESHHSSNIYLLAPSSCTAQHYKQYCYGRGLPVQKTYWKVPVCARMPWFLNSRRRSAPSKCNFKPVSNPSRFPFLFNFQSLKSFKMKELQLRISTFYTSNLRTFSIILYILVHSP